MLPDRTRLVSINPYANYTPKMGKRLLFKNKGYKRCTGKNKSVIFFISVSKGEKLECYLANL